MTRLILMLCFTNLLWGGETKDSVFPFPIQIDTLPNGLQIVTVPFDSPGLVTYSTLVRVGSRDETETGKTGFAHFFEHCMFRGTDKFTSSKYNTTLQEMAAAGNANTWFDRTYYYFTGSADHLEKMFEMEADRFRYLKYSEHDFKTEAGAVLGEYTKNFASPGRRYYEAIQAAVFNHHTYRHTTMGFLADIKDMPNQYEYSKQFYHRFYRPEYCTLILVGDVKRERVLELAKRYYGDWQRGDFKPTITPEPPQTKPVSLHLQYDGDTNYTGVFFRSPAFSDTETDRMALSLLLDMYFSSTSAIYRKLVLEQQTVSDFDILDWDTRDPLFVGVYATLFKVEDTAQVRDAIKAQLDALRAGNIDAKMLERIKSRRRYELASRLDTPGNIADALADYVCLTGDPKSLGRTYQTLAKITVEDLKRAASRYFTNEGSIEATLSAEEQGR